MKISLWAGTHKLWEQREKNNLIIARMRRDCKWRKPLAGHTGMVTAL